MKDLDLYHDFPLSIKGKRWKLESCDEQAALALAQKLNLPDFIARLLAIRNIGLDEAELCLKPTLRESLPDPAHLKDMEKAAKRLADAVKIKEKIAIFGDYDVDGATSSALLIRFFKMLGLEAEFYIPDRQKEGYGPNIEAFKQLQSRGANLIITVDCGTVAHEVMRKAKTLGMEVIIVDHHLSDGTLPDAFAVINPNRLDEDSPCRTLAAVGVSFLLAVAINRELRDAGFYAENQAPDLLSLLDLVALGTVCDVMPLSGLNRAFVAQGLKIMATGRNAGLVALEHIAKLKEPASAFTLGYVLGPRINAGGRVGQSDLGTKLLTTEDPIEAEKLAAQLNLYNQERQAIEALILEEAMEMAEYAANAPMIFLAKQGWHPGVVGIVASRLKDKFGKPTAVVTINNGVGKASARSVKGIDLGSLVTSALQHGLLLGGGGHAMAAGFTVEENQLSTLQEFFFSRLAHTHVDNDYSMDAALDISSLSHELIEQLQHLAPFGSGWPEPRILIHNLRLVRSDIVGEKHLRAIFSDDGISANSKIRLKTIAYREAHQSLGTALLGAEGKRFHLAGRPRINYWNGKQSIEMLLEDAVVVG